MDRGHNTIARPQKQYSSQGDDKGMRTSDPIHNSLTKENAKCDSLPTMCCACDDIVRCLLQCFTSENTGSEIITRAQWHFDSNIEVLLHELVDTLTEKPPRVTLCKELPMHINNA
eukprot:2675625-Karenia_brevis.AAC.1